VIWIRKPRPSTNSVARGRGAEHLGERAAALAAQVVLDLVELALGVGVGSVRAASRAPRPGGPSSGTSAGVSGRRARITSTASDGTPTERA
jgi:hypothetical protein